MNEAKFQVTSIQDDKSELMLSNGNVFVDLLRRQNSNQPQNEGEGKITFYLEGTNHILYHLLEK